MCISLLIAQTFLLWVVVIRDIKKISLDKEYIVDVWEIRKHKLYDSDSGSGLQLHSQSSPGERSGRFSQNGKFGQNGKLGPNDNMHLGLNVTVIKCNAVTFRFKCNSSAHNYGCMVDGSNAMAAM